MLIDPKLITVGFRRCRRGQRRNGLDLCKKIDLREKVLKIIVIITNNGTRR